ncbi:hypothetical protein C8R42DRAFT_753199, partial [Lentinula raphanica]
MSSQSSTMMPNVIILDPPECGYENADIGTILRNNITLYANAPHGYYIAPSHPNGDQYLFKFCNGANAIKAYEDLQMTNISNTSSSKHHSEATFQLDKLARMNQQHKPLPMRTGQQSYSSASEVKFWHAPMQSSRMAGPDDITTPDTVTQYVHQSDNNSLLPLNEITSWESQSPLKIYYYLTATIDHFNFLLIQLTKHPYFTMIQRHWLFSQDFGYIKSVSIKSNPGGGTQVQHYNPSVVPDWPQTFNPDIETIQWPRMIVSPHNRERSMHEITIPYGKTGYVVLKLTPKSSRPSVKLFGWDWVKRQKSIQGFTIYNGFDFVIGANERIVMDGYDGNIGLGPRLDEQPDLSKNFLASLEANHNNIEDASVFIIRFVHPHILKTIKPWNTPLSSLISFGPYFPFKAPHDPEANFSLPISTFTTSNAHRPLSWIVKLFRIGIAKSETKNYTWIAMKDEPGTTSSRGNQPIHILMDTGSPMTVLPSTVITKILTDENWLALPDTGAGGNGYHTISKKTFEKLLSKSICFEFQGQHNNLVQVVVQATEFLSWHPKAEAHNVMNTHYIALKGTDNFQYVLGQSWYWAAIVKHVIPRESHTAPFVQVMPNARFYDNTKTWVRPEHMVLKSVPSRFIVIGMGRLGGAGFWVRWPIWVGLTLLILIRLPVLIVDYFSLSDIACPHQLVSHFSGNSLPTVNPVNPNHSDSDTNSTSSTMSSSQPSSHDGALYRNTSKQPVTILVARPTLIHLNALRYMQDIYFKTRAIMDIVEKKRIVLDKGFSHDLTFDWIHTNHETLLALK